MADEAQITAAEQASVTEPIVSAVEQETETIGAILHEKPSEESVPLSKFLEMKKESKEMARQMKDLQKSIENGATKKEVATDLRSLSEKHGVDAEFLQEFADAVRAKADHEIDEKVNSKFRPLEEKERSQKIDQVFSDHYAKVIAQMPEYEGVVNKEVIKQLSLNPANANKTFIQIIEESYGHLITGKRSLDQSSSRAGRNDSMEVDVARAEKDPAYFKEVMENPTLKKKYNDTLTDRLSSYI